MKVEIKRWDTGAIIISGEYKSIKDCLEKNKDKSFHHADLRYTNLYCADLCHVDLCYANLRYTNLRFADLRSTDLRYADLRYANISHANLRYVDLKRIPKLNTPTINEYIKQHKIKKKGTKIYLFKGVTDTLESPQSSKKIKYTKGVKKVNFADCDVFQDCSYGISLSPTEETAKEWGSKVIEVEVDIGDIVCIPVYGHEKKIRVKKCRVL